MPNRRQNRQQPRGGRLPQPVRQALRGLPPQQRRDVRTAILGSRAIGMSQIPMQNPNEVTPWSSTTTTIDPVTGQPTRSTQLTGNQAALDAALGGLGVQGAQTAGNWFGQMQAQGPFNPQLTQRINQGDLLAGRQATEDAVYRNLTRNLDRDFGRERESLSQELANRGIPVGSELYNRQMQALGERLDQSRASAMDSARQAGLGEYGQMFNIGETARANDVALPGQIRNQQFGELGQMSSMGTPLMIPQPGAFNAPGMQTPGPWDIQALRQQWQQNQAELGLRNRALNASLSQMAPQEESAFIS